jgi:hypothetical protein
LPSDIFISWIRAVSNSSNPGASSEAVVAQSQAARTPGQIGNNVGQSLSCRRPSALAGAPGEISDGPGEPGLRSRVSGGRVFATQRGAVPGSPSGSHACERQYKSRKRDDPHRLLYTNNGSNQENHT